MNIWNTCKAIVRSLRDIKEEQLEVRWDAGECNPYVAYRGSVQVMRGVKLKASQRAMLHWLGASHEAVTAAETVVSEWVQAQPASFVLVTYIPDSYEGAEYE